MKFKEEELSIKGYLMGIMRALIIIFIVWFASEVRSLSISVAELNITLGNMSEVSLRNSTDLRRHSELIHNIDKRLVVVEKEH